MNNIPESGLRFLLVYASRFRCVIIREIMSISGAKVHLMVHDLLWFQLSFFFLF